MYKYYKHYKHYLYWVFFKIKNTLYGNKLNRENIEYYRDEIDNISIIIKNLNVLLNAPEFKRFDFHDYYSKRSLIWNVIFSLGVIRTSYKTDLNKKAFIINYLEQIRFNNINNDKILTVINKILNESDRNCYLKNNGIFLEIRNVLAEEWLRRNIQESKFLNSNFTKKDLNILTYNFEQYVNHLNYARVALVKDIEKFTNRYLPDHSKYIEVDLEILKSIMDCSTYETKILELDEMITKFKAIPIPNLKNHTHINIKKIILRGWFKELEVDKTIVFPKEFFETLPYVAYKRTN